MVEGNSELGEGFFWMAEKLAWGYEDTTPNLVEAFRLFKQAAELGVSDASIRVGQLLEHGKGTQQDGTKALKAYQQAAKAGNFFALAFAAKLVSRSAHSSKANDLWDRFFEAFAANPDAGFMCANRDELLHDYISASARFMFTNSNSSDSVGIPHSPNIYGFKH